jgi:DNA-directed RNA polymerase subunit RPC12/RpoP
VGLAVVENNWLCDFLELDIEDDVGVLEVIEGNPGSVISILNLAEIQQFIKDWNEEYCTNHDLCPECRAKLVKSCVDMPYGDTVVQEIKGLRCPYCG